jgi:heavy metal sensor kinase
VNTRSLRFRLVVWYAGWLTILFVVFGVFVYLSLRHHLSTSLQEALARRPRQVADLISRLQLEGPALGERIQSRFAPEANNRFTRVTIDGAIVYVSGDPADHSFDPEAVPPPSPKGAPEAFAKRRLADGTELFVATFRTTLNGKTLVIEEGSAPAPVEATLRAWVVGLVAGLGVLIAGAVAGGFLLVQRSLEPVDRITRSAEQISSRNLSERLPIPDTRDELERLSIALNNMIRRLDDAFQQTRRFLADASHELRTPLTMMHAEFEAILAKTENQREVRDLAASGLEEVERLRKIVETLFALSRLEAGEALERFAPFNLAEVAATTTEQMCLLAEDKNISMRCRASNEVTVEGDRGRLKQLIVNLLDNAIKYTPSGGSINIRVIARADTAVLEVADDGIGIPAEALPRVFDRFFRADKARSRELGGAGLGLSIVKSICTAHGGRVFVESKEGAGSRFIVELPLAGTSSTK